MEPLDVVVKKLLTFWHVTNLRRHLPFVLVLISLLGSTIKSLNVMPETVFSNSKNFLNVYFVKMSWAWHLALLLPFIALCNLCNRAWGFVLRRLSLQLVCTAVWYVCTQAFFYLEEVTGSCQGGAEFNTKASCRKAGLQWDGIDISGHSFILGFSVLVIAEELVPMTDVKKAVGSHGRTNVVLDALYVALNAMVALWIWMFACTSVYFHDLLQKLLGTAFGIAGWYITYRVWYQRLLSSAYPPKLISPRHRSKCKERKLQA